MAVSAHPDDLEYDGVASALARWTSQGKTVSQLFVTRGEAGIDGMEPGRTAEIREQEQVRAAAAIGVKDVEFLSHPDGVLEYSLDLRRDLARAIRRHRPDVIVSINFRDSWPRGTGFNHPDHRMLGHALIDAARDASNRWVFPALLEESLPPWQGLQCLLFGNPAQANRFVDIGEHLNPGAEALRAHSVYLDGLGGVDAKSHLAYEAGMAGKSVGIDHAVLFEQVTL